MSNLQVLARRCPIMGKAMAVQSAGTANTALGGVFGGVRAYGGKAKLHTTRAREATVGAGVLRRNDGGMSCLGLLYYHLRYSHIVNASPMISRQNLLIL